MRRSREHEIKHGLARVSATHAFRFAHVACGIACVRTRARNELRRQAVGLLLHADGIVGTIGILAIGILVIVVVESVVADLRLGRAIRGKETRLIGAIDLVVAIVVLAVVANLRAAVLARRRNEARRIRAIDEFVAIFVESARAHLRLARRHAHAWEFAIAIGIGAIDEQIAIVVLVIVTGLEHRLAAAILRCGAIGIFAVDAAIAIVVEAVVARRCFVRQASTSRSSLAIRVETVDDRIAIVINAVVTHFPVWFGNASAIRHLKTSGIGAICNAITVIVGAVETVLFVAREYLLIQVVAIATAA